MEAEKLISPHSRAAVVHNLKEESLYALPAKQALRFVNEAEEALKAAETVDCPNFVSFKGEKVKIINTLDLPYGCFEDIKGETNAAVDNPDDSMTHALEAAVCGLLGCHAIQTDSKYDTKELDEARLEVQEWPANEVAAIASFFFLPCVMPLIGTVENLKVLVGSPKRSWLRASVNWVKDLALSAFYMKRSGTTSKGRQRYLPLPQTGYSEEFSMAHTEAPRSAD